MDHLKIAVILGSTRPGRNGKAVADWVVAQARGRTGAAYELVDLLDYPLPHLDEPRPPSMGQYKGEHTEAWSRKIVGYDGFIFVTPEYNHSTSGVLKNPIDYLYAEWNNKAAANVGYGTIGRARAIEHLRAISAEFNPSLRQHELGATMFDQLEAWAGALRELRSSHRSRLNDHDRTRRTQRPRVRT